MTKKKKLTPRRTAEELYAEKKLAFTHAHVWTVLEEIANEKGYSMSGMAKASGLDGTALNPSKRVSKKDGRQRWPSLETISLICGAMGITDFAERLDKLAPSTRAYKWRIK